MSDTEEPTRKRNKSGQERQALYRKKSRQDKAVKGAGTVDMVNQLQMELVEISKIKHKKS